MHFVDNTSDRKILREQRNISKCAGLRYGRILLLVCLLFLFIPLRPVSIYLFALFFLVPWILSNIIADKKKAEPILLGSCAKKYHYDSIQLMMEQLMGRAAVFFLAVWQVFVSRSVPAFLQLAPGIILLLYLLCRITSTMIVRRQIHHYYTRLLSLEN